MNAPNFRRATLTGASLLLVSMIGAGIGVAATTAGASPATPSSTATRLTDQAAGGGAGDAALAAIVDQALDPAAPAAAGDPAAAVPTQSGLGAIRNRLGRWRALVEATVTVNLPQVGLQTFQVDHGTISAVGASSVTLTEAGGKDVTITTGQSTRVRKGARKAQVSDLAVGDDATAFSRIGVGGSTVAVAIVVPRTPASPAAPATSPTPQPPSN